MAKKVEKFPFISQLLYSSGYTGISIADRIWVTFMIYFLLPPKGFGMPELVSNKVFFGVLTTVGVITIFGRVVDAIADPIVATWSDRSKSTLGRRKIFMLYGGLPLILTTILLFFPPVPGVSVYNAYYVAFFLSLVLIFFPVYVTPYLALIPELSHTDKERMNISTFQAVFSLLGLIIVMIGGFIIWDILEKTGISKTAALQTTIIILGIIGLIFLYVAVIPIDEKKYCMSSPSEVKLFDSLKMTLSNKPFIPYLFGTICLWFGLNIVSSTAIHYVRVLLNKPESFSSILFGAVFGVALLFFPIINAACKYIGKKAVMIVSLVIFGASSAMIYYMGADFIPLPPIEQAFLIFGVIGIPVSALLVVPNAMISDIAEYDAIKTGTNREAMYFGAQGLVQKLNLGISAAVLAYLLARFGKDLLDPLGVKLTGPVTAVVCLIGVIIYFFYPEKEIMASLEKKRAKK